MTDQIDDPTTGVRDLLPEPDKTAQRGGGTHFHKPGCRCYPCKARARDEETQLSAAGGGEQALVPTPAEEEIVEADILIPAPQKRSRKFRRYAIAEWIKQRAVNPDITTTEIAKHLGIARQTMHAIIQQATQEGWLRHDDPLSRIDYEIIPKALDNLNYFLEAKDKLVTIKVAEGTIFKSFQEAKGLNPAHQSTVLALKIELPPGASQQGLGEIIEGQIVGQPKILIQSKE